MKVYALILLPSRSLKGIYVSKKRAKKALGRFPKKLRRLYTLEKVSTKAQQFS